QGAASLALGYEEHWAFSPPLLNLKLQYLIADLAVLKWDIACIFCSTPAPCLKAFALTGRDRSNTRYPGCRFACPGLGAFGLSGRSRPNPKLE
ncbi:hypothetical protein, partial [Prevotellamassilia timonensis]